MYQKILGGTLMVWCYMMPVSAGSNKFAALAPADLSKVVTEAQTWQGTRYQYGGKDQRGIDCSHFVYAIYHRVLAVQDYRRADDYLVKDPDFSPTTAPHAGDVIVFPAVNGLSAHVGILTDIAGTKFIGSQSSTGVKETSYAPGTYWGKRPYRMVSLLKS
jgi:cell wall-associated NlpC family hydrolase